MGSAKILIIEDEWLVANELAYVLQQEGHEVVAIAANSDEALGLADKYEPDLVLVDLTLGDELAGPDAAEAIRARHGSEIVFITGHSEGEALEAAKRVHASGYLVKPYSNRQLRASVQIALHNLHGAPDAPKREAIAVDSKSDEVLLRTLSEREREVFEHLASGQRVAEVACKLFISAHTVRKHSKAIFRKLSVHSQIELIRRFGRKRLPTHVPTA